MAMPQIMRYVFDTSVLSAMFKHYFRDRFPTLWGNLDSLIAEEAVVSVREVKRELGAWKGADRKWIREHAAIFTPLTARRCNSFRRLPASGYSRA